jgi:hypothetical protein
MAHSSPDILCGLFDTDSDVSEYSDSMASSAPPSVHELPSSRARRAPLLPLPVPISRGRGAALRREMLRAIDRANQEAARGQAHANWGSTSAISSVGLQSGGAHRERTDAASQSGGPSSVVLRDHPPYTRYCCSVMQDTMESLHQIRLAGEHLRYKLKVDLPNGFLPGETILHLDAPARVYTLKFSVIMFPYIA